MICDGGEKMEIEALHFFTAPVSMDLYFNS